MQFVRQIWPRPVKNKSVILQNRSHGLINSTAEGVYCIAFACLIFWLLALGDRLCQKHAGERQFTVWRHCSAPVHNVSFQTRRRTIQWPRGSCCVLHRLDLHPSPGCMLNTARGCATGLCDLSEPLALRCRRTCKMHPQRAYFPHQGTCALAMTIRCKFRLRSIEFSCATDTEHDDKVILQKDTLVGAAAYR